MSSFGLYLHIPYCVQKCPYCDFNSYGVGRSVASSKEQFYIRALCQEIENYAHLPEWKNRPLHSIFFGGGTPSLLEAESIGKVLDVCAREFELLPDTEITLEANPGTVQEEFGLEKLIGFVTAGVNRVSFGSQSFSERKLRFLGRLHSPADIEAAVQNTRKAGVQNLNLDLIFGIPEEDDAEWVNDLKTVIDLNPEHISAYTLTIERGTAFDRRSRAGEVLTGSEDQVADLYQRAQDRLAATGYLQYEVSNYAKEGFFCRHNEHYWLRSDYLGVGAGAHSFSASRGNRYGSRWWNVPGPEDYIAKIQQGGAAVSNREELGQQEALLEFFFQRVRYAPGFSLWEVSQLFGGRDAGATLESLPSEFQRSVQKLTESGLLVLAPNAQGEVRFAVPRSKMLFADSVVSELARSV